ncbi:succinylglutamate-semialdehyde dehydrogenase [Sphingomonas bacterium]|uniref:succinylglutamate-semialdehyde dehydrogenase n=1 Tax=Sphingomonas bacterium TaxID=1895847 RepID=UPI0015764E5A|nr:succinylglutamate-semialdehyde dehydrogenase [Sphingomonas bacterium]
MSLLIGDRWREGCGERLRSTDPASGDVVWEEKTATAADCAGAVAAARHAFSGWARMPLGERIALARRFAALLSDRREAIAATIARETGKPRWEALTEVASMIGKVDASVAAQAERAGERSAAAAFGDAVLRHRPHGVMAVLGPFNFPGHLPNGHIVPALLAGNALVFKPSEETPATGEAMLRAWTDAGLPPGVVNLVQGGREVGAALVGADIDGLLFTGSATAGAALRRATGNRPEVILALELGGNNPLIAWDGDAEAIASIVVQSAFVTAGQRCSCARRLIVPDGAAGDAIVDAVAVLTDRLRIGAWNEVPEPFCGPLISAAAADRALAQYATLVEMGGRAIREFARISGRSDAFVAPGLIDVTGVSVPDEEVFAPLLQVIRVADFDAAIDAANATRFGLAAGLVSDDDELWARYRDAARAGVLNRNRPTTGAAGTMPFGGIGASGNHRPSAYYAADYCAYPVASFEAARVVNQVADLRGVA